jgi:8-oxo-dGDP phosphatase
MTGIETVGGGTGSSNEHHPLEDVISERQVIRSERVFQGMIWEVRRDTVELGPAGTVRREYVRHPGAVTVLAMDDREHILMIRQYRHAVGMELWELPAGLLDVTGELPLAAAQRELAEEADLRADRWHVLAEWFNSPGGMDEAVRLFLARDLHEVPAEDRHARIDEEHDMPVRWVPLDEARDAVLAGHVHNPGSVVGILAACASREQGWSTLRPAEAPWPAHPAFRSP